MCRRRRVGEARAVHACRPARAGPGRSVRAGGTRHGGGRPWDAERIADDPTDALDLDVALDTLFSTSPDAFVAARNALVKRLRAAKRRDDATAVAALRKPPRAVWALNHLALSDDPHLADLLDAIERVGVADAATHRDAVSALRDRIGDTVDAAVGAIEAPRSEDHPEITRALQAVVGDADTLRLLVDGRLVEVPVGGMGALALLPSGGAASEPRSPRPGGRARPKLGVPHPSEPEAEAEAEAEEGDELEAEVEVEDEGVAAEVDDSMAERRAARERRRLEEEAASARAAHEAATAALEQADAAVAEAEEQLTAAAHEVAAAEAALAAAQASRDEQDDTLAEARSAHEAAAAAEADARSAAAAAQAELDAVDP